MELRQEKKNNTLRYILLCVLAGLVLAVGAAIRTVYGADMFIAYEHEKLYHEFKETYPLTGTVPEETSDIRGGVVLVENDNFTVSYTYYTEDYEPFSLLIVDKNTGEDYSSRREIYGVNSSGEIVETYAVRSGKNYYDPYTKEFESTVRFVEINEDKVVAEVLLMHEFFVERSDNNYSRFMTVEDFEAFVSGLDEDSRRLFEHCYDLTTIDEMSFAARESLLNVGGGDFEGIVWDKFSKPFYCGRNLSVTINEQLEEMGYTIENTRMQESKFIKKGYEAPLALARFTIDIGGEELTYDAELVKVISPKKSDVVDILVPEDPSIAIENTRLVKEGISEQRKLNYDNVVKNINDNYAEYPVDFELTLGKNKVDCTLLLNKNYGFGTMNVRIIEDSKENEIFYSGTITEGEPLNLELLEAKYTGTNYRILMYNDSYIYEWQISVTLSGDDISVAKKNFFFNKIENISFEAYEQFSDKQLSDFCKNFDVGAYSYSSMDYFYTEAMSSEMRQRFYEYNDQWVLDYFRSADPEARYLIEVRTRTYDNRYSDDDPLILSVEVSGNAILEPFYTEYGDKYYLTIKRLDDGAPAPYSLFGYRLY